MAPTTSNLEQVVGAQLLMGEWAASPALYQPWLTVMIKVLIAAQGTAERAAREAEAAEVSIKLSHKSWPPCPLCQRQGDQWWRGGGYLL
jgi:hypothetical protein